MRHLEFIPKGIKRAEREKPAIRNIIRLPMTPAILLKLKEIWKRGPISKDTLGCMHTGLFWIPVNRGINSTHSSWVQSHSTPLDICFDHLTELMFIIVKSSKTDPTPIEKV